MICNLCPRNCNALRTDTKGGGLCGMPALPVAARAALHQWEEPPISGTRGSGTLFFSGCPLQCVFCQNEPISHQGRGKAITPEHLRALCFQLIDHPHPLHPCAPGCAAGAAASAGGVEYRRV